MNPKETSQETIDLDPRLEGLRHSLVQQITNDALVPQLVEHQLLDKDGAPLSPLTKEGLEMLLSSLVSSVHLILLQSQVLIPPDASFDELLLADRIVNGLGATQVNVEENTLKVRFTGEDAIITKIHIPLENATAASDYEKPVCLVDVRRIRIYADSIYGIAFPDKRADIAQ